MHEIRRFDEWGILVITYSEPFSVRDLMDVADALSIPGPGKGQHSALLIDLRQVSISGISGDDSRRFISVRKTRMPGIPAEPAAFLIRSNDDFANIRRHNLWSEALELRKEYHTMITVDVVQALSWLARMTNQPRLAAGLLPHL